MEVPYGLIYRTSRVENGVIVRQYIGQHKLTGGVIEDGYLGSGILLTKAIKKYGRDCFAREIVELCYSHKQLNEREVYWVDYYQAHKSEFYYNIAQGGANAANCFRKEIHQYALNGVYIKSFDSMVEAASATPFTSAGVIGACANGRVKTAGGFQWRFEKLENIPKINRGKDPQAVSCYTLEGEYVNDFESFYEAADFALKANSCNIGACCKGKISSCGGYQWRYYGHKDEVKAVEITYRTGGYVKKIEQRDPVTLELLNTFKNAAKAAEVISVNRNSIRDSCNKSTILRGYRWCYEGEEVKPQYVDTRTIAVDCVNIETNEVVQRFESMRLAAEYANIEVAGLTYRMKVKKVVNGTFFKISNG